MLDHAHLRRKYEAACKGREPQKFFEDLSVALAKKEVVPNDFSIRRLFEQFVPDGREMVDSWNPRQSGGSRIYEATADAVNSSAFANITGQIVYNELLAGYQSEAFVFSAMIPSRPTAFNGEKIAGITGLGDVGEAITEGSPYPTAGVSEDWVETPQTTKRGLIVPVTKEAIFFDRTAMVLDHCSQVGYSLGLNKEKRAIDAVVDENTTAHRYKWKGTTYATYQASTPWVNITTGNTLVDHTDLDAAEQVINALVDPHTGEPILTEFTDMIVVNALELTARRILNSTEIVTHIGGYTTTGNLPDFRQANPYLNKYKLITSRLLASRMATDTSWFLGNIAKAVRYMENWPITTVQAPPNSEAEFNRDIVTQFKASERGAFSVVDPRLLNKSTVA